MSEWKATRTGINLLTKTGVGLPFHRLVRRSYRLSTAEFWDYQKQAFLSMYRSAFENIPYYRSRRTEYPEVSACDGHLFELLEKVPILSKAALKAENERFWPTPLPKLSKIHTTSGTSGTPLRIAATLIEKGRWQAVKGDYFRRKSGQLLPRSLNLSGFFDPAADDRSLYWRDHVARQVYLSIYQLSRANRAEVIGLLRRFRPHVIHGYSSAVHELAALVGDAWAGERGGTVGIVTSEVLLPQWRGRIEASICRRVYDFYSSQEAAHLVVECEQGQRHINPLVGVVEILDENGRPSPPGEIGRVVVTGLLKRSMPLIRYEVGDSAYSTGYVADCTCSLNWPTIGVVEGRSEDLVQTRDGRRVGYLCFHATKDVRGVQECQLVQTAFDSFVCNLVPNPSEDAERGEMERLIRGQITARIGYAVDVEFRYVEKVPRGPGGKFKAVVVDFEYPRQRS